MLFDQTRTLILKYDTGRGTAHKGFFIILSYFRFFLPGAFSYSAELSYNL